MSKYTDPAAVHSMMMAVNEYKENLAVNIQWIRTIYANCDAILGQDIINYRYISRLTEVIADLEQAYRVATDLEEGLKRDYIALGDMVNL